MNNLREGNRIKVESEGMRLHQRKEKEEEQRNCIEGKEKRAEIRGKIITGKRFPSNKRYRNKAG